MDLSPFIIEAFKLWWVILILLVVKLFKTPWFKGLLGEALVKYAARRGLPVETYHRTYNVTLPTPDGTTQIDHIFVSRFGIFVVETKNMKGWIFGRETEAQWTQKIFKKSFKFQNPLRQNYKHVKAVEAALDVPAKAVHSIVVFVGDCTFKSPMPANVNKGASYITYIKSFREPVLSESQVQLALSKIKSARLEPNWRTHHRHVMQLKTRDDPLAERRCPKCGSMMILRTAKRGGYAGKQFWCCSAYPKCRMVQNVS